jgi:signal transduction histidine kinase
MEMHKLLQIYSYITFGFFCLFLYQTVVNYLVSRQKNIDRTLIQNHIGLCASSTVYAFITFALVCKASVLFNLKLMHLLWISGSLVNYYYIRAIKKFLNDTSDGLKWMQFLPLISAAGALLCAGIWAFTGRIHFADSTIPFKAYNNLFMQHIGGFNAGWEVKSLGLLIFIPTVYSSIYFFRFILQQKKPDLILLIGIGLTLLATVNDIIISVWDGMYLLPFMFGVHIFEILRITHFNQTRLVKQLRETNKDLIETAKLSEVGSNYALLAHEIFNPLQAAAGYFEVLVKRLPKQDLTPEMQKCINQVQKQHLRIENLARNVKKNARISSQTELAEAMLVKIVQDSLDTIHMKAYAAGVKINYKPQHHELKILCIQDQIIQVITNLLSNSIEAVNSLEQRWIEINHQVDDANKKVLVSVKDSGAGIDPAVQDKIWEHRFTTKKETGVGIGLNLCLMIINQHGGTIYLNKESLNTEFVIELPLIG